MESVLLRCGSFCANRYNPLHEPHWLKRAVAEVVDMVDANCEAREISFTLGRRSVWRTSCCVLPPDGAKTFPAFAINRNPANGKFSKLIDYMKVFSKKPVSAWAPLFALLTA
jgi:hypothetical protein